MKRSIKLHSWSSNWKQSIFRQWNHVTRRHHTKYVSPTNSFIVIHELEPDIVVIPGRGDHQFSETVEYILNHVEGSKTELQRGLTLEYKATAFLSRFGITDDLKKANSASIEAGSALLATLKRCAPHQSLPIELEWFSMSDCMTLDYDSLMSLQIMSDEPHPNMHMSMRRAESGLSLSSLLNKCKSPAGRKLMRQWILRPLKTINAIRKRHDIVESLIKNKSLRGLLAEVHNVLYGVPRVEVKSMLIIIVSIID